MLYLEYNLDGLIGPTHFFGGLGKGNIASENHAGQPSSPKAAALQGLAKMKMLHDLGVPQLVMPPHPRPALFKLRTLGYAGTPREMLAAVKELQPELLPIIYSSSAMWTANAATVTASADAKDGKLHFTPANLISNAHRAIETEFTAHLLRHIFSTDAFVHHLPLSKPELRDEGAANHMRLRTANGEGVNFFIYGASKTEPGPTHYPARQSKEAFEHVAAQHQLSAAHCVFLQQHPDAIDGGVFHNDVIATSYGDSIFYHELAYADEAKLQAVATQFGLKLFRVASAELSLKETVDSYLFNSQIVQSATGEVVLIAPRQCEQSAAVVKTISVWIADEACPIQRVIYVDVDQSMANGGGPACLRLRVPMHETEAAAVHAGVKFSKPLYDKLGELIEMHYPDIITAEDLLNPNFPARILPIYPKLAAAFNMPDLYKNWL